MNLRWKKHDDASWSLYRYEGQDRRLVGIASSTKKGRYSWAANPAIGDYPSGFTDTIEEAKALVVAHMRLR